MWQYIQSLTADLRELTPYVENHIDLVKKLLKKPPGKKCVHSFLRRYTHKIVCSELHLNNC